MKLLVDSHYLLEKFPGKGGWTYAAIPEVLQNPDNPFGWVKVNGKIDDYALEHYKLMPMGNGSLFLPVKAEIRKKIRKEAGDTVHVVLYADEQPLAIPQEVVECLKLEPGNLYERFVQLPEGEQKVWLDWMYSTHNEELKAQRMVEMMEHVQRGIGFYKRKKEKGKP